MTIEELSAHQPPLTDGGAQALAWLRQMRAEKPVYFNEAMRGWFVYRHADAVHLLSDHRTFSSEIFRVLPGGDVGRGNLANTDPPRHRKLRQMVSQAFTPRMVAGLAPRISELTDDLLDHAEATGSLELVDDIALRLPVIVIAELLGLPAEDHQRIASWAIAHLGIQWTDATDQGLVTSLEDAQRDMNAYLDEQIEKRRARSRDDLISKLIEAEVDGERMDEFELRSFAALLLLAGHVTTTALLGNTWLCLEENPDARSQVQKDPSLLPTAIDEVMRYRPSLTMAVRVPNEDVVLHGHEIAKNTMVYASLLSANRDERAFGDPDVFDIHRPERHHLSFGHGIHYCLGAPLAKQEVEIVYRSLLTRFPTIHRDPAAPLEFWETPGIFAPKRLELSI